MTEGERIAHEWIQRGGDWYDLARRIDAALAELAARVECLDVQLAGCRELRQKCDAGEKALAEREEQIAHIGAKLSAIERIVLSDGTADVGDFRALRQEEE